MSSSDPVRLAHLSCMHCGAPHFDGDLMAATVENVNRSRPDLVLVAGNLTNHGYEWEYDEARRYLDELEAPLIVVPGSDDSRNVGFVHYQHHFGDRHEAHRLELSEDRRSAADFGGITVVALDSSEPDLTAGRIGREWYPWLRDRLDVPDDLKVVLFHHHLVAIPGAGREATVIEDAGDVLALLSELTADIILTGSRHVPFFWGLNGILICNSGAAGSRRIRGTVPPSRNELEIDADRIRIYVHYEDGSRQLAAVRSRAKQLLARARFSVTDDFFASNHLPVG